MEINIKITGIEAEYKGNEASVTMDILHEGEIIYRYVGLYEHLDVKSGVRKAQELIKEKFAEKA